MLTTEQIEEAKTRTVYSLKDKRHEHDDCIRMAYEWLDAQVKTKGTTKKTYPLKHIIEKWAGRYVSTSDVEVAATLHPEIIGEYPHFNISARLTLPAQRRLSGSGEAGKHGKRPNESTYSIKEN